MASLEANFADLDTKFVQIHHWVQIVHDIECGYGDPLKAKVTPQFSLRLVNRKYEKENNEIQKIQVIYERLTVNDWLTR